MEVQLMKKKIKLGIIVILLFVCIDTILDISTPAFEEFSQAIKF
ncbi:hypothetical protein AB4Y30_12385 [Ornithinibacillus sp. 4-3]|uniref:Uncharacterized protein n=1 Tax=Ornithinibacillus sp. 4-3 TaxID=3231488 RepID=A0AB39HNI7_9BACI